jgi:D-alanine-D-alanine ligase
MINKQLKICILGGGWSNEREISLKSSNDVYKCLKENNHNVVYYDMSYDSLFELETFLKKNSIELVFNLIHGEGGEDGTIQSYLDSLGIAYCGSDSSSSKISFNKYQTKRLWSDNNISTPEYEIYTSQSYDFCKQKYGPSFFIKDTCSGSSNNIYLISNANEYMDFTNKHDFNREYMIEEKITADEYTAAIIHGNILPIIRITPSNIFYDYDAKYKSDLTKFTFPEIEQETMIMLNDTIRNAYNVIGCSHWGRLDFFIKNKEITLLEINTIPGMTDHSLVPKAAKKNGISYYQLILMILDIND